MIRIIQLFIIISLTTLAAEDAYHRRLLLPPCDAYGSSKGKLKLVNGGDRPVRLRLVRYSCGCLSGKFSQEAMLRIYTNSKLQEEVVIAVVER
ncbi:MAG: hypothetical protein J6X49_12455 [Victivallales bacterium]|nr:hypothetical protein [Victivallales bacterium]